MTESVSCSDESCERAYPDHKWGRINASKAGWFFQNSGEVWCPAHTPEWVEAWRARKNTARPDPNETLLVSKCLNCGGKLTRSLGERRPWDHTDGSSKCPTKVLGPTD